MAGRRKAPCCVLRPDSPVPMPLLRFALCLLLLVPALSAQAGWLKAEQAIMGTRVAVELWAGDEARARGCIDAVMAEMRRVDALMSPFRDDSELARINREAAERPVPVSTELFDLIERALELSRLTDGAFDITFASVGYLYDYRQHRRPDAATLAEHLPAVDWHQVRLDRHGRSVRFGREGVRIDLGGIAKGHAVDRGIAILRDCGIRSALVTAGGDSRILGDHHGRPWMMGIKDPRRSDGIAVVLPLADTAISTSGDYERFFIEDGKRYHHILSPKTGRPVEHTRSVTVLGPDATTTDGLSTAFFVLGPQRALALCEKLPGIDAVIIDAKGTLHYSSGLMPPDQSSPPADGR